MKEVIQVHYTWVLYDPELDHSEHYGWKRTCDEHVPTEQEQDRWGRWSLLVIAIHTVISLTLLT